MTKILESRLIAALALVLVIVVLVLTFSIRPAWWAFIDIFLFFLAAFMHLLAVNTRKVAGISRQLDVTAFWLFIFAIVALVVEWILFSLL